MPVRPGFSLVELLLVCSILAAVLLVAAPAVARFGAETRVANAASVVAADLSLARTLAGQIQAPVRLGYDAGTGELRLTNRVSGALLFSRGATGTGSELGLDHVALSATVDAYPNGLASGALSVSLGAGGTTRTVAMTRAGRITISSP